MYVLSLNVYLVILFWHPWQIYQQIWLISADKVVKCRYIMYRQRCRYMKILPICYRQILSADSYIGRTLPHISIWFEWVVNLHILFPALSEQRAWHQQAPSTKSTIHTVTFASDNKWGKNAQGFYHCGIICQHFTHHLAGSLKSYLYVF